MSEEEDVVDIKFRLGDGSDLGPFKYNSSITVAMLKERIISDWPKGLNSFHSAFSSWMDLSFSYSHPKFSFLSLTMMMVAIQIKKCHPRFQMMSS